MPTLQEKRNAIAAKLAYSDDKSTLLLNGKPYANLEIKHGWSRFYSRPNREDGYGEIRNTGLTYFADADAFYAAANKTNY